MSPFIISILRPVAFEEGRLQQARHILLELATEKIGPPDQIARDSIDSFYEARALERQIRRVLTATSWQELLATDPDR